MFITKLLVRVYTKRAFAVTVTCNEDFRSVLCTNDAERVDGNPKTAKPRQLIESIVPISVMSSTFS